jgi:peptidoglycan/LPS O-acetylase OafA/YrhL
VVTGELVLVTERRPMIGLRAILLLVAVILFVVAALGDSSEDWISWGLACLAGAFLVGEAGLDRRFGRRR